MEPALSALLGGVIIGAGAGLLLLFNGRIAGATGIASVFVSPETGEILWRACFIFGLLTGGLVINAFVPGALPRYTASWPTLVAAGVLVGFGARLGGGCTSGHGVCGVGRLSKRSIVAAGIFTATGMIAVFFVRHVFGG
jgi:uncharacterized membrane protein YedE/YeeE